MPRLNEILELSAESLRRIIADNPEPFFSGSAALWLVSDSYKGKFSLAFTDNIEDNINQKIFLFSSSRNPDNLYKEIIAEPYGFILQGWREQQIKYKCNAYEIGADEAAEMIELKDGILHWLGCRIFGNALWQQELYQYSDLVFVVKDFLEHGITPHAHYCSIPGQYCRNGSLAELKNFLQTLPHTPSPKILGYLLHIALYSNQVAVVDYLIAGGADCSAKNFAEMKSTILFPSKKKTVSIANPFFVSLTDAIVGNSYAYEMYPDLPAPVPETLHMLLGLGVATKPELNYALVKACNEKHLELCRWALEHGADPNAAVRNDKPLLELFSAHKDVSEHVYTQITRLLLDAGANPNIADPSLYNRSPLMLAAYDRLGACMPILVDAGAQVDYKDSEGTTVIDILMNRECSQFIPKLIQSGQNTPPRLSVLMRFLKAYDDADFVAVLQIKDELLREFPDKIQIHLQLMQAATALQQFQVATDIGRTFLSQEFSTTIFTETIHALHCDKDAFQSARDLWLLYRGELAVEDHHPLALAHLLNIYAQANQYKLAVIELSPWAEANQFNDKDAVGMLAFNMACIYAKTDQAHNALRMIRRALSQSYSDKKDLIKTHADLHALQKMPLMQDLLFAKNAQKVNLPGREISRSVIQAMLSYETNQLIHQLNNIVENLSPAEKALLTQFRHARANQDSAITHLTQELIECYQRWAKQDFQTSTKAPLGAVYFEWGGVGVVPYDSAAAPYGFAKCLIPESFREGRVRFTAPMFEHCGDVDLEPVLQPYIQAIDNQVVAKEHQQHFRMLFQSFLLELWSQAAAISTQSEAYITLRKNDRINFFAAEHDDDPKIFFSNLIDPSISEFGL